VSTESSCRTDASTATQEQEGRAAAAAAVVGRQHCWLQSSLGCCHPLKLLQSRTAVGHLLPLLPLSVLPLLACCSIGCFQPQGPSSLLLAACQAPSCTPPIAGLPAVPAAAWLPCCSWHCCAAWSVVSRTAAACCWPQPAMIGWQLFRRLVCGKHRQCKHMMWSSSKAFCSVQALAAVQQRQKRLQRHHIALGSGWLRPHLALPPPLLAQALRLRAATRAALLAARIGRLDHPRGRLRAARLRAEGNRWHMLRPERHGQAKAAGFCCRSLPMHMQGRQPIGEELPVQRPRSCRHGGCVMACPGCPAPLQAPPHQPTSCSERPGNAHGSPTAVLLPGEWEMRLARRRGGLIRLAAYVLGCVNCRLCVPGPLGLSCKPTRQPLQYNPYAGTQPHPAVFGAVWHLHHPLPTEHGKCRWIERFPTCRAQHNGPSAKTQRGAVAKPAQAARSYSSGGRLFQVAKHPAIIS